MSESKKDRLHSNLLERSQESHSSGQIENDGTIDPVRLVKVLKIIVFSSRKREIERRRHLELNKQKNS